MSADASERRISLTIQSIMADTPAAAAAAATSDDAAREDVSTRSTATAATPSSNVSQPSPSRAPLPSRAPSTDSARRKRPLPEGDDDGGGQPESSSAAAVANRRRSHKVSRACDFCKAKKLKCSGTIPCDVCTRKRLSCIYDASYRRGRPPTPPPAPATAFSESPGEARVSSVFAPLVAPANQPIIRSPPALAAPRVQRHRRPLPTEPAPIGSGKRVALPEYSPPPAGAEEGTHPASRTSPEVEVAEIEGQYFDTTSSLTFLHRAWKRLSSQRFNGGAVPQVSSGPEQDQTTTKAGDKPFASQALEPHALPERTIGLDMLRFYFDVCVVTYRCLHQGYVTEWFEALLTNAQGNLPLHHGIGHAKAAIVKTILAIVTLRQIKVKATTPLSPEEGSDLRRSDSYFCQATNLTDMETGLPKLESAQARLLQVLYLLQTSRMNQAWYVFGSILPIISALGLHRKSWRKRGNSGKGPQVDYIVAQCRKRTFWVAYTIDKYLAVVFGRPRLYHDDDIDQDFPDCVNDEDMTPQGRSSDEPEMDCHVESLIFHAKLAQLIDGISREVYSIKPMPKHERLLAAHRYGRALHDWRESLPHHLGTVRPMSLIPSFRRQNTALKLAYCHAIMHANRPFLLGTPTLRVESQPTALDDSVEECISAAKTALETVDAMANDGTLFHAFWWTPYVTFCALAVVYVWKIQRGEDDGEKSLFELADRCQNHLAKSTTTDSPSRRYSVILEELREEAQGGSGKQRAASEQADIRHAADPMQIDEPSGAGSAPPADMGEVFQAQGFEGMPNLFSGWEATDWLDLDSSALATFPDFEGPPAFWMPPVP